VKASDSTLYGAALINNETASEIKTDLSLSAGTRWYMSDSSTVTNLTNSESKIYLSNYESQTFDKGRELIVNGDYHGDNGSLYFRTVLNGDDSPTDKLEVKGNTSGSTNVYVTNAGGTGEATINGIELITVGGDSSGVFNQVGRITAGAYEYELNKINKNW
ncbi:autotransporter outer membrane beta-barrel domain-containing protein, partial [Escherichia coli]|nr:autotransporter outer membrane beta-barrel domain-containing protein [Escherichia coli]